MVGGYPPDETPIPVGALSGYNPSYDALATSVETRLDAAMGDVSSAIDSHIATLSHQIQSAKNGVDGIRDEIDGVIVKAINKTEDKLIKLGLDYPLDHPTRVAVLSDESDGLIAKIFPVAPRIQADADVHVPVEIDLTRAEEQPPVVIIPIDGCITPEVAQQVTHDRAAFIDANGHEELPVGPCVTDPDTGELVQPTVWKGTCNVSKQPGVVIVGPCVVPGPCRPCGQSPPVSPVPTVPPPTQAVPVPPTGNPPVQPAGPVPTGCCPPAVISNVCPPVTVNVPPLVPARPDGYVPPELPPIPGLTVPPVVPGGPPEPEPPNLPPPPAAPGGEPGAEPGAGEPGAGEQPGDGKQPGDNSCHVYWDRAFTVCSDIAACVAKFAPAEQPPNNLAGRVLSVLKPDALKVPTYTAGLLVKLGIATWTEEQTGVPYSYLMQWERYDLQYACPVYLIDQSAIDELYLKDIIDFDKWTCLTRSQGNIPEVWVHSLNAKQEKPTIPDLCDMRDKGYLTDKEWEQRMRAVGCLDKQAPYEFAQARERNLSLREMIDLFNRGIIKSKEDLIKRAKEDRVYRQRTVDEVIELQKWIPGPADLIRYMKRDAADPKVVEKFHYDKDFADKYGPEDGNIAKWAKAQGLAKEVFQYEWFAHWEILSYTQLTTALHRLYPGSPGETITFDESDMRYALEINDMAPGMVDVGIAISYNTITNSDARRAYLAGFFKSNDLWHAFRKNGYRKDTAQLLVDFERTVRERTIANQTGVLTMRKLIKGYKEGSIVRSEALKYMANLMPDEQVQEEILDRADFETVVELRSCQLKAIKKRYNLGDLSVFQLVDAVNAVVHDPQKAIQVAERYQCERAQRQKEPRVAMLCQWYTHNLIDADEYVRRLNNLGYTYEDAFRIASVCYWDEVVKRYKAQAAATKALIAELEKDAKQKKQDRKEEIAAQEKRLKELQKQIEDAKQSNTQPAKPGG